MSNTHERRWATELSGVDLNSLLTLDAILEEANVTQAALRLNVTQSAVSHSLRRLRDVFDDPLLVRAGAKMKRTPRAEALRPMLRDALLQLSDVVLGQRSFDAKSARRTFRLVAPDLFEALVLPALAGQVATMAPGVDLEIRPITGPSPMPALASLDLDLAIVPVTNFDGPSRGGLRRRTLFRDTFRCFVRRTHPLVLGKKKPRLGLRAFADARHVLVSPTGRGEGYVDKLLRDQGRSRRVALRVPLFQTAARVVEESDLILTAPAALERVLDMKKVMSLKVPVDLGEHGIAMLWHERVGNDPGHAWLRDTVAAAAQVVVPERSA